MAYQKKEKKEIGLIVRISNEPTIPEQDKLRRAKFFLALFGLDKENLPEINKQEVA